VEGTKEENSSRSETKPSLGKTDTRDKRMQRVTRGVRKGKLRD